MAAGQRDESLDLWAEGGLVVHQDGSISSTDDFWGLLFGDIGQIPETSGGACKSNAKAAKTGFNSKRANAKAAKTGFDAGFDFKRALAGASDEGGNASVRSSRPSSMNMTAMKFREIMTTENRENGRNGDDSDDAGEFDGVDGVVLEPQPERRERDE